LRRELAPDGELPSELSSSAPHWRSPTRVTVKGKSLRDGLAATLDRHCARRPVKTSHEEIVVAASNKEFKNDQNQP
jgi:hypothetical protein